MPVTSESANDCSGYSHIPWVSFTSPASKRETYFTSKKDVEIQGPETRTAWAADQLVDLLRDPGPLCFGGREAAVQGLQALAREFRFGISGKGAELVVFLCFNKAS